MQNRIEYILQLINHFYTITKLFNHNYYVRSHRARDAYATNSHIIYFQLSNVIALWEDYNQVVTILRRDCVLKLINVLIPVIA